MDSEKKLSSKKKAAFFIELWLLSPRLQRENSYFSWRRVDHIEILRWRVFKMMMVQLWYFIIPQGLCFENNNNKNQFIPNKEMTEKKGGRGGVQKEM